jgi:outer membrane murein-binding lipoprotein Lpp
MCPLASNYRPSKEQLSDQVSALQARVAELEAARERLDQDWKRRRSEFKARIDRAVAELEYTDRRATFHVKNALAILKGQP